MCFIRNRNESYLPLPSQPQLILIYRPRRDGRLSRPRCEIAPAEIQTCNLRSWYSFTDPGRDGKLSRPWCDVAQAEIQASNLLITNPALYHTAL